MAENPLKIYEKLDPALLRNVQATAELALADGALSRKVKLLMAMALDAAAGATEGVKSLARSALAAGATHEEVAEAVRVAGYVCGAGAVYTAAHALDEVL